MLLVQLDIKPLPLPQLRSFAQRCLPPPPFNENTKKEESTYSQAQMLRDTFLSGRVSFGPGETLSARDRPSAMLVVVMVVAAVDRPRRRERARQSWRDMASMRKLTSVNYSVCDSSVTAMHSTAVGM